MSANPIPVAIDESQAGATGWLDRLARRAVRARLQALQSVTATLVFYESSHRILASVADMADILGGEREATLARELTKTFETVLSGSLASLLEQLQADSQQQKGEFVVMVHGAASQAVSESRCRMASQTC